MQKRHRADDAEFRDIAAAPLNATELEALIDGRDYRQFLNARNELFRERKMAAHPPSRAEAIRLMALFPNLIRRPIIMRGSKIVIGYDEKAIEALL